MATYALMRYVGVLADEIIRSSADLGGTNLRLLIATSELHLQVVAVGVVVTSPDVQRRAQLIPREVCQNIHRRYLRYAFSMLMHARGRD